MEIKNKTEALKINLEPYKKLLEKSKEEVKGALNDTPELFVTTLLINSEELRDVGKKNGWASDEEAFREIKKKFLKQSGAVTHEQLLGFLINVLNEKKPEKPVSKASPKKSKSKEKDMIYETEEGLLGLSIKYGKEFLTEEEFKEKIEKELKNSNFTLEFKNGKVKVVLNEVEEETESSDEYQDLDDEIDLDEEEIIEAKEENKKEKKPKEKKAEPKKTEPKVEKIEEENLQETWGFDD